MPWNLPGPAVTGNPIPASWGNNVNGDLTILQTNIGLFGATGAMVGSTPAVTAPNFLMQAGTDVQTTNSGGGAVTHFTSVFPNGILCVVVGYGDNGYTGGPVAVIASQVSTSGFGWQAAGANTVTIRVNYVAIGF